MSFLFSGFHFNLVSININNTSWHQIPVIWTKVLEFCGFENAFGSRFSSLWLLLIKPFKTPFKTAVLSSSFPYFFVFFPFNCLVITKVYSGIQTYQRSVSLSPLTIFFPFNCSVITKVYSSIQTYRRSVSLSPLTIIFFLLTALFITKVYSGIQTYRRSVSLSPLTIFSSAFNSSVIRKV